MTDSGIVGLTLYLWTMYIVVAAVLSAPVVILSRKRVHWQYWELLILVLPFALWYGLMLSDLSRGNKSLANIFEISYVACAVPVAALARVAVGRRIREPVCAAVLIALVCAVAAVVFFAVPAWPE